MLMFYPCETYRRNNYKFCPDCGVSLPQTPCPVSESDFWKQVEDEALTLGAMLEAYGEVAASNMLPCPSCNFNNEPDALFCGSCGTSLADAKGPEVASPAPAAAASYTPPSAGGPTCGACGASNEPGAGFCEMCGAGLESSPAGGAGVGLVCGACGAGNEPGAGFCEMCGAGLSAGEIPSAAPVPSAHGANCPSCGHQNEPGAAFCEMCGAGLADAAAAQASLAPGVVALPDPTQEMEFDLGGAGPMDDFSFEESSSASPASGDGKTCNVCGSANPPSVSACEVCGSSLD